MNRLIIALCVFAALACEAKSVSFTRGKMVNSTAGVQTAKKYAPAKKVVKKTAAAPKQSSSQWRQNPYVGAVALDAQTGRVLFRDRPNAEAYPASVTKLMTLLLVLDDVKAQKYSLDSMVVATPDAYRSEPSWVGIKVGEKMSVRDLCYALMIESANDAAIVLAVNSAGSLEEFVSKMNARAASLGMTKTRYYNPNGLPPNAAKKYPWKSFNVTTASDQIALARALLSHPEVTEFTSVKTCDLIKTKYGFRTSVTRRVNAPLQKSQLGDGEKIVKSMRNHNNVMVKDKLKIINPDGKEAVDGLKTGYINAGGSSVILTGTRNGRRAIVVVLGSDSSALRDESARHIMLDALGAL